MQVFTTRSSAGGDMAMISEMGRGSFPMIDAIKLAWLSPLNAFCPVAIS